jgi:uncharacterized metal-binding protein (TIGR02443 family)
MADPKIIRKRFIAGAVCPQCQVLDRVVVEFIADISTSTELSRRRCVSCGFADEFNAVGEPVSRGVPKGRPERGNSGDTRSSVVRFVGGSEKPSE